MTEGDHCRLSVFHSLLKFCVRHSSLWFARWTQQCLVVKKCEKLLIWLTFDHRIHAVVIEKKNKFFFFVQTKSEDGVNSLFQEAISVILKSFPTRIIGFQTFIREIFFK